jgi:hypothetical protein
MKGTFTFSMLFEWSGRGQSIYRTRAIAFTRFNDMLVYLASFDHHRTAQCHKIGRLAVILCELNLRSDRQLLFVLYVVRIYDVLRRHKVHHIHRDIAFVIQFLSS